MDVLWSGGARIDVSDGGGVGGRVDVSDGAGGNVLVAVVMAGFTSAFVVVV